MCCRGLIIGFPVAFPLLLVLLLIALEGLEVRQWGGGDLGKEGLRRKRGRGKDEGTGKVERMRWR